MSKKLKQKKELKIFAFGAIFLISLLSLISSFGVSAPYWEDYPLQMYPGETQTINLNIQNMAGATEDVTARIEILNGSEIVSLEKNEYLIEAGTEINVPVKIEIPSETLIGTTYPIKMEVKTVTPGGAGAVALGVGMGVNFNVVIGEQPEVPKGETPSYLWILIILIVIILVIIIIVARKKEKHVKESKKPISRR